LDFAAVIAIQVRPVLSNANCQNYGRGNPYKSHGWRRSRTSTGAIAITAAIGTDASERASSDSPLA
jgi:hypothetical protein